ncbi:unnamed protein product [Didymodactylos carnosus]|uniref:Uncharacterized protein n=1 Tax=Didymodactylos carnosus TaxID=1234261 RepID=A0A814V0Z0_9BILA|nr:unnamed protein product [Didymodactylos carnosus]CAF3949237.1 unnamed protein product [Didymodactylos carnosus]
MKRPTIDLPSDVPRKISTKLANVDDRFMYLKMAACVDTFSTTSSDLGKEAANPVAKPILDFDSKTNDPVRMSRLDFDASVPYLEIGTVQRLILEDLLTPITIDRLKLDDLSSRTKAGKYDDNSLRSSFVDDVYLLNETSI